jgi:hypothetical protein
MLLIGASLILFAISVFWLKDHLASPLLARFAYSGLVARLAVLGGALVLLGTISAAGKLLDLLV